MELSADRTGSVELIRMDLASSVSTASSTSAWRPNVDRLALDHSGHPSPANGIPCPSHKGDHHHAVDEAGLFRGSRTLIQLLEQGRTTAPSPASPSPTTRVSPGAACTWMCAATSSVEFVKKYIDLLARYKMNSFHWHLTEDQGWRIEIKKYPKLTEVGAGGRAARWDPTAGANTTAFRTAASTRRTRSARWWPTRQRGTSTWCRRSRCRGMPWRRLAAYPDLGCTGGPYEVQKGWGVFEDVFCAGNDSTFAMLEDVLTEVMDLFPSPYHPHRWRRMPQGSVEDLRQMPGAQEGARLEGRARTAELLHPAHREVRERQGPEDHRLGRDPGRWPGTERGVMSWRAPKAVSRRRRAGTMR
jgi:hypothetical protein